MRYRLISPVMAYSPGRTSNKLRQKRFNACMYPPIRLDNRIGAGIMLFCDFMIVAANATHHHHHPGHVVSQRAGD